MAQPAERTQRRVHFNSGRFMCINKLTVNGHLHLFGRSFCTCCTTFYHRPQWGLGWERERERIGALSSVNHKELYQG